MRIDCACACARFQLWMQLALPLLSYALAIVLSTWENFQIP